jgi:hypothetical protein
MTPAPHNTRNLSLFIGLWLGLTFVAGLGVFALFYWASGDSAVQATQPVVVATGPAPTQPVAFVPTATLGGGTQPTQAAPACNYPPVPPSGFGYGIQSHIYPGQGDFDYWMGMITDKLHLQWVKLQVRWDDLEQTQGSVDWSYLDGAVNAACTKGVRVMLSIVGAPVWTQASPMPAPEGQKAPPDNYLVYADFVGRVVEHYQGKVEAIEVWNEQNLEREWNTAAGVNATEYVKLLQAAYTVIKSKDPAVTVIAGALAPTGVNLADGGRTLVIDDATYLTQFVQAGGLAFADCIGTHSNGTNLPPTADGANPPPRAGQTFGGPWDNPHYSWALKSQVETYAQILNNQRPQCVTEFGYASAVDGQYPSIFGFAADVSEQQQAEYVLQAYNWMRASGMVKLAFLFNLDYGPKGGDPATDDNVIFSILTKAGTPRPAFDAISLMEKP